MVAELCAARRPLGLTMLIGFKVERSLEQNSNVCDQKFQKLNNKKVCRSSGWTEVKTQPLIRNTMYKVQDQNWRSNTMLQQRGKKSNCGDEGAPGGERRGQEEGQTGETGRRSS